MRLGRAQRILTVSTQPDPQPQFIGDRDGTAVADAKREVEAVGDVDDAVRQFEATATER